MSVVLFLNTNEAALGSHSTRGGVETMNRYLGILWFGLLMTSSGSCLAQNCNFISGEQRWSIKTSIPASAELTNATTVDVQALIDLPNPQLTKPQRQALQDKRLDNALQIAGHPFHEGDIVSVEGYFYRTHCEHDGDYHVEIGSTPGRTGQGCLIVEIPDPAQVADAGLQEAVTAARSTVDSESHGWQTHHQRVQVVGQLFLDESHAEAASGGGGRGTAHCARHLWEIHPVTSIAAVSETADRPEVHAKRAARTTG